MSFCYKLNLKLLALYADRLKVSVHAQHDDGTLVPEFIQRSTHFMWKQLWTTKPLRNRSKRQNAWGNDTFNIFTYMFSILQCTFAVNNTLGLSNAFNCVWRCESIVAYYTGSFRWKTDRFSEFVLLIAGAVIPLRVACVDREVYTVSVLYTNLHGRK